MESSPIVLPYRGMTKTGSYPNPLFPFASRPILPRHSPSTTSSSPRWVTNAITHLNTASLFPAGIPSSSLNNFRLFSRSSAPSPAYRAERTPGLPSRQSTSKPESSAKVVFPVHLAKKRAFLRALSRKASPFSTTSGASG
jgi:hypothetical protein